jgi:excisionase family DNA binding protein
MGVTQTIWTASTEQAPRMRALPVTPRPVAEATAGAPNDAMMTIREVAEACRLSETAIRRAIYEGELQAVKLRSRLRITRTDFDAWIASQRRKPVRAITALPTRARPQRRPPAGTFRARIHDEQQARSL